MSVTLARGRPSMICSSRSAGSLNCSRVFSVQLGPFLRALPSRPPVRELASIQAAAASDGVIVRHGDGDPSVALISASAAGGRGADRIGAGASATSGGGGARGAGGTPHRGGGPYHDSPVCPAPGPGGEYR